LEAPSRPQCSFWLSRGQQRLGFDVLGIQIAMKKRRAVFFGIVWLLLGFAGVLPGAAQQKPPTQATTRSQPASSDSELSKEESSTPGQVVIDGRPIVTVYEAVGPYTPQQRADRIAERIVSVAKNRNAPAESVRLQPRDAWTELLIGDEPIMAVTDADARMAGKSRQQLASEDAENIHAAIQTYRRERGWEFILEGVLYSALTTLGLVLLLWLVRRIRFALRSRVDKWIHEGAPVEKRSAWRIMSVYLGSVALGLGALLRWALILALLEIYLTVTLGFFSYTRHISLAATNWLLSQLATLAKSALDYLPNLLVIAVIAVVMYYLVRLIRLIFGEIENGRLQIRGFYADWVQPTEKLVRMLVLILALIIVFPYLPGAKSPAFQGISIFVGVLLSLGSSSAVANAIAGIILTYMRSFLIGDWVCIGNTTGKVIEKNLLVTRILTPKQEVITIPNATVMSGTVQNYTAKAREMGVIFHTTVTIGYDAPWRVVHELLVSAALATKHILHQPPPFVLQTALSDFYVSYELNAYTQSPVQMGTIYSELHQNIQDKFNEAGVEICSPHFFSLRDGNAMAIPNQYFQQDYKAPCFRLNVAEGQEKS